MLSRAGAANRCVLGKTAVLSDTSLNRADVVEWKRSRTVVKLSNRRIWVPSRRKTSAKNHTSSRINKHVEGLFRIAFELERETFRKTKSLQ